MIVIAMHLDESTHILQLDREKVLLIGHEAEITIQLGIF
jgi:hypothetical protein